MWPSADENRQRAYFDSARNQYPSAALAEPPLHTALEVEGVVARLRGLRPGDRVADFGAGTGRLSLPLARSGYRVVAVDVSEASLAVLRRVACDVGVEGIDTTTLLPLGEGLAAIVGADVLHHVDLDVHLPRIHTALADTGRVVFSEPGGLNPAWYPFLLLRHGIRVERRIVRSTVGQLRCAFERHGFGHVRVTGLGLLPRPLFGFSVRACRWNDAAGDVPGLRTFAYRYVIEARKAERAAR